MLNLLLTGFILVFAKRWYLLEKMNSMQKYGCFLLLINSASLSASQTKRLNISRLKDEKAWCSAGKL